MTRKIYGGWPKFIENLCSWAFSFFLQVVDTSAIYEISAYTSWFWHYLCLSGEKKKDFIVTVEHGTLFQMKTQPECLCENGKKQEKLITFSMLVFKS